MPNKKRREREKAGMKDLILAAAEEIAEAEGFEKVSVRKIAKKIEYSPSIIYHYFADMDEIINNLMRRGYQKIVAAVSSPAIEGLAPEEKLRVMISNYIEAAMKMPEEFIAAHLNKSTTARLHTSTLKPGASKENAAMAAMFECVKEINRDGAMTDGEIELRSQLIVVSVIGLAIKLIIEEDIGCEQRQRLIEFFSGKVVLGMAKNGI